MAVDSVKDEALDEVSQRKQAPACPVNDVVKIRVVDVRGDKVTLAPMIPTRDSDHELPTASDTVVQEGIASEVGAKVMAVHVECARRELEDFLRSPAFRGLSHQALLQGPGSADDVVRAAVEYVLPENLPLDEGHLRARFRQVYGSMLSTHGRLH